MKICSVKDCDKEHVAKGYCDKHYQQFKKHGKTFDITIKDKNKIIVIGGIAIMDLYNLSSDVIAQTIFDANFIKLVKKHRWGMHDSGYARNNSNKQYLHRFLTGCSDSLEIDHINGNPRDNRLINLRVVTRTQNMRNTRINKNNTSGVKGVSWYTSRNKWCAAIEIGRRKIHLGLFESIDDAIKAREDAAIKYQGEYAYESRPRFGK